MGALLLGIMLAYTLTDFSLGQDQACISEYKQDIIVVLDSSTSIARSDFKKQIDFVNTLISKIDIGPDGNQVGVISFSDNYRLNFHLNANRDKAQLQKAVSSIKQMGGGTNTHKPLEYVRRFMFTPANGDRKEIPNVCFVITDGNSYEPAETAKASIELRKLGIDMYALGVGAGVDRAELLQIADDQNKVFQANSFDELNAIIDTLAAKVLRCAPPDDLPPAPVITGTPPTPVESGTTVQLRCVSKTTSPDASLQWFRDNELIDGTTYRVEGSFVVSYLTFNAALTDNESVFECLLRHPKIPEGRRAETKFSVLVVPGPPVITYSPGQSVLEGTLVTLTCTSSNKDLPNTQIVWIKGKETLPGQVASQGDVISNILIIPATLSTNTAKYECHVIHPSLPEPLIEFANITVVPVPGPPVITSDPAGPQPVNTRVTLSCVSEGTDARTKVVWYRSNRVVDSSYYESGTKIRNDMVVTASDVMVYECRVEHPLIDRLLLANHTVIGYQLPSKPVIKSPSVITSPDQPILLTCTTDNADNDTELVWVRGNDIIDSSFQRNGATLTNEHRFQSISAFAGAICEVRHRYLPRPLIEIPPTIVFRELPGPPIINDGAPPIDVTVGSQVTLTCKSQGKDRQTSLVWYQSDRSGPIDSSFVIQGDIVVNTLTVTADSSGARYECRVSHPNLPQSLSATTSIPIKGKLTGPIILGEPEDPVQEGTTLKLMCSAEGANQRTQLTWFSNGAEVDVTFELQPTGDIINELDITLQSEDPGLECVLSDPDLETQLVAEAKVVFVTTTTRSTTTRVIPTTPIPTTRAPPRVTPGSPVITGTPPGGVVAAGRNVTLRCTVRDQSGEATLQWYVDDRIITTAGSGMFTPTAGGTVVSDLVLKATSAGRQVVRCRLTHPLKTEDRTEIITTVVPGSPQISGIPSAPVSEQSQVTLLCTSNGTLPDTKLVWYSDGRPVDTTQFVRGGFTVNEYQFSATRSSNGQQELECRLEYPPASMQTSAYAVVSFNDPGDPVITQVPEGPSRSGTTVTLICQALHNGNTDLRRIRMEWLQRGQVVDSSAEISGLYIRNSYQVSVERSSADFECRVTLPGTVRFKVHQIPLITDQWLDWSAWSPCSRTCGPGVRTRLRECEGACEGDKQETQDCILTICESSLDCRHVSDQADIAFLLDTSSSVYEPDFEKMKLFLADFITLFNVSTHHQRIASLTFSDEVRVNFYLKDFNSNEAVQNALLSISMHMGGTMTAEALEYMRRQLFAEINGARANSPKIGFVITDGRSYEPDRTTSEAALARQAGIIMYSIGIGPSTDQEELKRIAGDSSRVYHVDTYDDIVNLKQKIGVDLSRCFQADAPVHGEFGPWTPFSQCSVTCGSGSKVRTRVCDNPPPRNQGRDCLGQAVEIRKCKLQSCNQRPQDDGGWTEWEFSSRCSATCGRGTQEVYRICQAGNGCLLGDIERKVIECSLRDCPGSGSPSACGGEKVLNIMLVSQSLNNHGPNSYLSIAMMKNLTSGLPINNGNVRTSLTLGDCACSKNEGFDLAQYSSSQDILQHLNNLDLEDTASILRKARIQNNIVPRISGKAVDGSYHKLLLFLDSDDLVTPLALAEAEKLKLAGVKIFVIATSDAVRDAQALASEPLNEHYWIVQDISAVSRLSPLILSQICKN